MRQISDNVFVEVYFWGCNPSFLRTSDGVVMFDTPQQPIDACRWREMLLSHGPIRHLINTEPHADHIWGNASFPGIEVIGHETLRPRYGATVPAFQSEETVERFKQQDPDSVWLLNHPMYPPNPPTRLFDKELDLHVGNHTLLVRHTPGHTLPQTSIILPDEGVVVTGDNIFQGCRTFIQEADPWQWLDALRDLEAMDIETIVPGHGEPCGKDYVSTQRQIIEDWTGFVEDFVRKGMSEDEAAKQPLERHKLDPFPLGQRLWPREEWLNELMVRNIHRWASKKVAVQ